MPPDLHPIHPRALDKLWSLTQEQRLKLIKFAMLIRLTGLLKNPDLTNRQYIQVLKLIKRLSKK
jgi:hypothetical protein